MYLEEKELVGKVDVYHSGEDLLTSEGEYHIYILDVVIFIFGLMNTLESIFKIMSLKNYNVYSYLETTNSIILICLIVMICTDSKEKEK